MEKEELIGRGAEFSYQPDQEIQRLHDAFIAALGSTDIGRVNQARSNLQEYAYFNLAQLKTNTELAEMVLQDADERAVEFWDTAHEIWSDAFAGQVSPQDAIRQLEQLKIDVVSELPVAEDESGEMSGYGQGVAAFVDNRIANLRELEERKVAEQQAQAEPEPQPTSTQDLEEPLEPSDVSASETIAAKEEDVFTQWRVDFTEKYRAVNDLLRVIVTGDDFFVAKSKIEELKALYENAVLDYSVTHASQLSLFESLVTGAEKRLLEESKKKALFGLTDYIINLRSKDFEDVAFKKEIETIYKELFEKAIQAETELRQLGLSAEPYKIFFEEAKSILERIQVIRNETKQKIQSELTAWRTELEKIDELLQLEQLIEDILTNPPAFEDCMQVASSLESIELSAQAKALATLSTEAEMRTIQELELDTIYWNRVKEAKELLSGILSTPEEIRELQNLNFEIDEALTEAERGTNPTFHAITAKQALSSARQTLSTLVSEGAIPQEYLTDAREILKETQRLLLRIDQFVNEEQRIALQHYLALPEIRILEQLIAEAGSITNQDIIPHARPTRRNTYNTEQLQALYARIQAAIADGEAANLLDLQSGYYDDKHDVVKRKAQDIISQIYRVYDNVYGFIDLSTKPPTKEAPYKMKVKAIVDELVTIIFSQDPRINQLKNEFLNKIGSVKNNKLSNFYRLRVGMQEVSVTGDPGKKDFGVYFDAIMPTLSGKYVSFLGIARALFLNPTTETSPTGEKTPLTAEQRKRLLMEDSEQLAIEYSDMTSAEVDTEMIRVWDYIVTRIKGKFATKDERERAGLYTPSATRTSDLYDRTKPWNQWTREEKKEFDLEFDYNHLAEDAVDAFMAHLKKEFAALAAIPDDRLEEMIKYSQHMAAKSAGYVPWLLAETTRAHGGTSALLEKKPFSDELFALAPFSAGYYSRGRYAFIEANATAEDALYMPKDIAMSMIGDNHKRHEMGELWDMVNHYRLAKWGEIPQWVIDVREMIKKGTEGEGGKWNDASLNLNENWMPMPGEVSINIARVEKAKRDFLRDNPDATPAQKKVFADIYIKMGYGKDFDDLGLAKLSQIDQGQYKLSFDACDKMFSMFRDEPGWIAEKDEVVKKFRKWLSDVIGKAKLIPGKHQLLFAPYTMRMMYRLVNSYTNGNDRFEVDEIRREMTKELLGAGGVPKFVKEQVLLYLQWDKASIKKVFDAAKVADPDEENPGNNEPYVDLDSFKGLPDRRIDSMIRYKRFEQEKYKAALYSFKNKSSKKPGVRLRKLLPLGIGKKEGGVAIAVEAPWDYKPVSRDTTGKSSE